MTLSRNGMIAAAVAIGLIVIAAFIGGRGCSGCEREPDPIITGIDAGPGEALIEAELDAALVAGRIRIEEIEEKFEEDMAAFDENQREEYERLRGGDDLDEAARFLSAWNKRRRDAGP